MEQFYESRWSLHSCNSVSTEDLNWSQQSNYLKMMNDTNLIDSCAAAKDDMESVRGRMSIEQSRKHFEFLETNNFKTQQASVDAEQLEQWIVYMDKYLKAFSPNWKQVIKMDSNRRNECFGEQYKLRQYIASHHNVFNQMVREDDTTQTRRVHNMYHMLLLTAIEKQCLLEENHYSEQKSKDETFEDTNVQLDGIIARSTETLFVSSDSSTTVPSDDDGVHFPTHPTTSKSSSFSEVHCLPLSSYSHYERDEDYQSWESIIEELNNIDMDTKTDPSLVMLRKKTNNPNFLISKSSIELIRNVGHGWSAEPNGSDPLKSKVNNWLLNHHTGPEIKIDPNTDALTLDSDSEVDSNISIQWDNYQDIYTSTTPMCEDAPSNEFLFFGDDYEDALKWKRSSSSSSTSDSELLCKSATHDRSSIESKMSVKGNNKTINETRHKNESDSASRIELNDRNVHNSNSRITEDILLLVENLQKNYKNLTPRDFDGVLKICRDNLECLLVVLDKNHSHYNAKSMDSDYKTAGTCQCDMISRFFARIVKFLYGCSRKVRKSAVYKFLFNSLKRFYFMVKFLSRHVRFYRMLYDSTV